MKLTGIASTGAVPPGVQPEYGELLAPGLYGPNHQHWFNVRLDMMVDGPNNALFEVNSEPAPPGPRNPHGNAWVVTRTPLRSEWEAQRTTNQASARHWLVANPSALNELGRPVGYRLVPMENASPLAQPAASITSRAAFITKHLWATRYDPAERFAAGDYPNQHPGGAGLPAYTARDRSLDNTDLVVWYSMAEHHVPRPEDWPVMPVATVGFKLQPVGFFMGNPALDVPPAAAHGEGCHEE